MPPPGLPDAPDFWKEVNFSASPTGCWIWCGDLTKFGHGIFRGQPTHRVALFLAGVDITDKVVRHRCDNAPCVNPAHLETGTQSDNTADMISRRRAGWRRKKLETLSDMLEYVMTEKFARAIGVDPQWFRMWMYGPEPVPLAVAEELHRRLGAPIDETIWHGGVDLSSTETAAASGTARTKETADVLRR